MSNAFLAGMFHSPNDEVVLMLRASNQHPSKAAEHLEAHYLAGTPVSFNLWGEEYECLVQSHDIWISHVDLLTHKFILRMRQKA